MNQLNTFSSAAIFGSVARGDNDTLSDRDLLVISQWHAPEQSVELLRQCGYSPAAYTWRSLESLSRHKSLFLLHLKLEGKIVKDENARLEAFLSSVEASRDYSTVRGQSVALAALTSGVPDTYQLKLWAADVLAVAVRNYLVAFAAERGMFIFAYNSLIEFADNHFKFSVGAKQSLLDLRKWKANYRDKGLSIPLPITLDQIVLAQQAISSMTGVRITGRKMACHEFAHQLLDVAVPSEPWYHAVRRYEGAYRSIDSRCFDNDLLDVIESKIASPTCYTNDGQVLWKVLRKHVRQAYEKNSH
ncbi:MAG: nucleotidyltransferase domain-containing protein [Rhodocyclaceae bacterium]